MVSIYSEEGLAPEPWYYQVIGFLVVHFMLIIFLVFMTCLRMRREEKRKIIASKLKSFKDGTMGPEMNEIYQTMAEVEKEKQMLKDPNARIDLLNERAMLKQAIKRDPAIRTEISERDGAVRQRRNTERWAKPEEGDSNPFMTTSTDSRHTEMPMPSLLKRNEERKSSPMTKSAEKNSLPVQRSKTVRF